MEMIQSYGVSYIAQQLQRDREMLSIAQSAASGHLPNLSEEVCHLPLPPDPMLDFPLE
jgi:hypothetical protein